MIPFALTALAVSSIQSQAVRAEERSTPSAEQLIESVLSADPWGLLSGADVTAKALVSEANGRTRQLQFEVRSRRYAPLLTKSLARFKAPADITGTAFLQIQRRDDDDERFLFTPELKRSRRVASKLRATAFMGTDFSYADLDWRDLRNSNARLLGEENVANHPCYHLNARPTSKDSQYGRIELWIRKDNQLALRWRMYDASDALVKTLDAKEIKRINGRWFITRSIMSTRGSGRSTELILEKIEVRDDIPDAEFTLARLERS